MICKVKEDERNLFGLELERIELLSFKIIAIKYFRLRIEEEKIVINYEKNQDLSISEL